MHERARSCPQGWCAGSCPPPWRAAQWGLGGSSSASGVRGGGGYQVCVRCCRRRCRRGTVPDRAHLWRHGPTSCVFAPCGPDQAAKGRGRAVCMGGMNAIECQAPAALGALQPLHAPEKCFRYCVGHGREPGASWAQLVDELRGELRAGPGKDLRRGPRARYNVGPRPCVFAKGAVGLGCRARHVSAQRHCCRRRTLRTHTRPPCDRSPGSVFLHHHHHHQQQHSQVVQAGMRAAGNHRAGPARQAPRVTRRPWPRRRRRQT